MPQQQKTSAKADSSKAKTSSRSLPRDAGPDWLRENEVVWEWFQKMPGVWPSAGENSTYSFEDQVIDFRRTFLETEHGRRVLAQIGRAASGRSFGESDLDDTIANRLIFKAGREWLFGWISGVIAGRFVQKVEHEK